MSYIEEMIAASPQLFHVTDLNIIFGYLEEEGATLETVLQKIRRQVGCTSDWIRYKKDRLERCGSGQGLRA